jgi:predicted transcriptional regulator
VKSESRTPANVRISPHAHEQLRQLAKEEEESMQAVLDKAIEHYRREEFLRHANADFAALKRNSKALEGRTQREGNVGTNACGRAH